MTLIFVQFVALLECFEHQGRVVRKQADHPVQIGMTRHRVFGVGFALCAIELVGVGADDVPLAFFDLRVGRIKPTGVFASRPRSNRSLPVAAAAHCPVPSGR